MASRFPHQFLRLVCFYSFGLFNWILYLGLFIRHGAFFKRRSEQDQLQLAIERDRFWNLSKSPLPGFQHRFHTLRDGLKLHYICNRDGASEENVIIFLHGFPDSSMMWRHLLQEPAIPTQDATIICVDLPGYGGSDSFERYDTQVLEAMTEFVVAMRDMFISPESDDTASTFIVGHDWGCILGFRLASEAPCLADRFILTNAPHVPLGLANTDRILSSASKIFKQFRHAPRQHFGCLSKSLHTLRPLLIQVMLMGYIFIFNLPALFVRYIGVAGNYSFLRGAQKMAFGRDSGEYRVPESMASTLGPGLAECQTAITSTSDRLPPETYGASVAERAQSPGQAFWNMTGYYRDGIGLRPWKKSLETITDLYALENTALQSSSPRRRRSSVSSPLFAEQYRGSLKAPVFILWGEKDPACSKPLCLDGIGDYLAKDSEVTLLPRTGHWTPVEPESRAALATVIGLYAGKDATAVPNMTPNVQKVYDGALMMAKR